MLLQNFSSVGQVIISIAVMLLSGYLMSRVTKKLKLPNVTGYIIAGIIIGPYCIDVIPTQVVEGMSFLADIALAFIAFSTGEFFTLSTLKKNGAKNVVITVFEALLASLVVFLVMYFALGLSLAFSIVLGALAAATAPASTMMTIRQTNAKGDFVDTLLQVVALDDVEQRFARYFVFGFHSLSSVVFSKFSHSSAVKLLSFALPKFLSFLTSFKSSAPVIIRPYSSLVVLLA